MSLITDRLVAQHIAQKEAFIKRAVGNALDGEAPGLTELQGRLQCIGRQDGTECWTFDNEHVLTLYPPQYIGSGTNIRVTLQGVVHNEPEPEALPETGEVLNYVPGRGGRN